MKWKQAVVWVVASFLTLLDISCSGVKSVKTAQSTAQKSVQEGRQRQLARDSDRQLRVQSTRAQLKSRPRVAGRKSHVESQRSRSAVILRKGHPQEEKEAERKNISEK